MPTVEKSRIVFEEPPVGPEFDLSEYTNLNQLANSDALAERVRYAALVASLRETRVQGRQQDTQALRRELLAQVDEAVGNWFEMRRQAPAVTINSDIEGESWTRKFAVWAIGTDDPEKLSIEIFERLA